MSEPKTPLGRIFSEQARQDVPDDLDGWPEIFSRLEAEGIAPEPILESERDFVLHIPNELKNKNNRIINQNKEKKKIEPAIFDQARVSQTAFKRRRSLALTGLGLVAALAIFIIAISAALVGNKPGPSPTQNALGFEPTGTSNPAVSAVPTTTTAASPTIAPTVPPTAMPAPTATPTPQTIGGVTVNGANFSKQGKLAFVSNGNLFVLDGENGQTRQLTQNGGVAEFKWSYDGEWLAYKESSGASGRSDAIYLSKYDGTGNIGPIGSGEFAWSPIKDELAYTLTAQNGANEGIQIINTNKVARLIISKNAFSPLWSPDGLTLAYATFDKIPDGTARIETIPTTDKVVFQNNSPVSAQEGAGIKLLSWWPDGKGLLFQNIPANSASLSMDGLPVKSVDLTIPNAFPQQLVKALVNTDWLSWSPDGKKFAVVEGAGRQLTVNKSLVICNITISSCQPVPQPANTVSLNPAWSPDGNRIAFVRAASGPDAFSSETNYANWLKTNAIWLVNSDGSNSQAIAGLDALGGLENPRWSADSKQLLVPQATSTGQDTLWLATLTGETGKVQATTRLVAQPVGNPTQNTSNYYAYSDWPSLVNWLNR